MPHRRLLDDCFLHDKDRLRHDEALAILRERLSPVAGIAPVALADALGRVCAEAVTAPRPVPAADNAAVDGYAFAHGDYEATGGFFPVTGRIAAGHPSSDVLPIGGAVRIFTGATVPGRADTVAMQEDCEPHEQDGRQFVVIPPGLKPGANRRKAGEDLMAGETIVEAGTVLRPQEIGAIASTGAASVGCFAPLKVAVLSTGDEILGSGAPFRPGAVYDSNRPLLSALLATLPVEVTDLGIVADRPEAVRSMLTEAAATHDAILSTGGASRGEEDHVIAALSDLGRRHMWQLAIKPGRPMTFGQIGDSVVLGLPGNPVAAFVCFVLYVRQAILALGGAAWREPRRYVLQADFEIARKKADRREFLRGVLVEDDRGTRRVTKFARDGSGLITSLREADGLIEIPEDVTAVASGDPVRFLPFSEVGLPSP
ncbi:gephyrin-like molybdotransferase Glp [Microbaculum marinum]|uniref:Molybdopterin molybdenumtransferase n=1 Tax=Microbaculum marinum TaxID=1764581 RepID=A0AAW9RVS4_9HYPH